MLRGAQGEVNVRNGQYRETYKNTFDFINLSANKFNKKVKVMMILGSQLFNRGKIKSKPIEFEG